MKGSIAITEEIVKYNKMGWSVFDLFKYQLKLRFPNLFSAGWYAYKLEDRTYYFLWADQNDPPSVKYLQALKSEGYELGISARTIEDAF